MNGVADRLRAHRAVDEEIGHPALAEAEAEPAAQFDPALIADGRRDQAVAGDGRDDAGAVVEGLHEEAVDVAFDHRAEQVCPLPADLDQIGAIGAGVDCRVERIERDRRIGVTADALP